MIIGGDFNIDLIRSFSNNESMLFLNTLLQNNLECHIFKATRISYYKESLQVKSATLIDQISSNLAAFECSSGNLYYPDSDHFPCFVIFHDVFERRAGKVASKPIYRRNLKKIDTDQLQADATEVDWNKLVINEPNLNTACSNLIK